MSTSKDFEVGYAKPPVHSRFQPGRSGNLMGRPRKSALGGGSGTRGIAEEEHASVLRAARRKVSALCSDGIVRRLSAFEAAMETAMRQAIEGDIRATKYVDDAYRRAAAEEKAGMAASYRTKELTEVVIRVSNKMAQLAARGEWPSEGDLSETTDLEVPGGDHFGSCEPGDHACHDEGVSPVSEDGGANREGVADAAEHFDLGIEGDPLGPMGEGATSKRHGETAGGSEVVGEERAGASSVLVRPEANPQQAWPPTPQARGRGEPLIPQKPLQVSSGYYGGPIIPSSNGR